MVGPMVPWSVQWPGQAVRWSQPSDDVQFDVTRRLVARPCAFEGRCRRLFKVDARAASVCSSIHTYIHTYTHTCIHTSIHPCVHIYAERLSLSTHKVSDWLSTTEKRQGEHFNKIHPAIVVDVIVQTIILGIPQHRRQVSRQRR